MEFIGAILLAHLVGDYLLQSHWMATQKTERWWPAIVHGVTYTLPFLFITQSPLALLVIGGTHIIIDRFRLAKYVTWLKNQVAPKSFRYPWKAPSEKITSLDAGKIGVGTMHVEDGKVVHGTLATTQTFDTQTKTKNNKATGFPQATPDWLGVWLMIIADNTIHLIINLGAVLWL